MSTILNLILSFLMCFVVYKVSFTFFSENTAVIVTILFGILLGILTAIFDYKRLNK